VGERSWDELRQKVVAWASGRGDIVAVALVGSRARGAARADSDIDLVIVARLRDRLLFDRAWVLDFGGPPAPGEEDHGLVQSLRSTTDAGEVEWAITDRRWCTPPIDDDTARVVRAGIDVLYDPQDALARMLQSLG
jgi:hypothetical protein